MSTAWHPKRWWNFNKWRCCSYLLFKFYQGVVSNRFFHLKTWKIPLVNLDIKWRKKSGLKNTYEPTFKLTFTFFPYHSIRFKRWNYIVTKAQQFKYGKYLNTTICHYFVGFLKSNMCLLSGKLNSKGLFWQCEVYSFVLIAFPFSKCRCLIIKTKIEALSLLIDEMCHGLSCYGFMVVIKHNAEVLRTVSTKIGTFT